MTPDAARLALRPVLDLAPASAPEESFQNETLRPILKLQHDNLATVFRLFLEKRKVRPEQTPVAARLAKVKELVTRDNRLRGLLFGMVIGHFTTAEMDYYRDNDGAVNRRLTNLLGERLSEVFGQS